MWLLQSRPGGRPAQPRSPRKRMALSADDLMTYCRRFLENYKIPRRIEFSEAESPKSGTCKIRKRTLRERFWANQVRAVGWMSS